MDINKLFLKFMWGGIKANTILKEKNKVGRLILFDFKSYSRQFGIGQSIQTNQKNK